MSQPATGSGNTEEPRLPRRDWILLPSIGLLTICIVAGSLSLIAQWLFPQSKTSHFDCMVLTDPSTGERGIPGCVSWGKMTESQPVEYRFNGSGYRADVEFGPKPPGTYRIALVGTSVAFGLYVPRERTFAALLPEELTRKTGRKVELHNESWGGTPHGLSLRFNEVLADKPDLVLWVLTSWDIQNVSFVLPTPPDKRRLLTKGWSRLKTALTTQSIPNAFAYLLRNSFDTLFPRSGLMLRHYLYRSQGHYVESYLSADDYESGFLRADLSAAWRGRLQELDGYAADIEARASAAGVPLAAVLVPNRAQAGMISMGEWPAGFDPYRLNDEIRSIVTRHGGIYVDILPGFRHIPDPGQYYFAVDGHPDAQAHAIFSRLLAGELTSGAVTPLSGAAQPPVGLESGK